MVMTLVKGPVLELLWTKGRAEADHANGGPVHHDWIKGSLMISAGCFSWSFFMILQVNSQSLTHICIS